MKSSTLQDVARVAKVSTATVSRTLSNPGIVSESTRRRVAEAVEITGYRINRAARNLRTQRAHSVLVLLPDLANPFFSTILEGISRTLSQRGYSMLIASTLQVHDGGERLIDYLDDARADGMIILDGGLDAQVMAMLETAPQAGRILAIHARPGERPGPLGIAEIGDIDRMIAKIEIYQSEIAAIRIGAPVTMTADALTAPLDGTVARIGLQIRRQTLLEDDPAANTDGRVVEVTVTLAPASSRRASGLTNLQVRAKIGVADR